MTHCFTDARAECVNDPVATTRAVAAAQGKGDRGPEQHLHRLDGDYGGQENQVGPQLVLVL